MKSRLVLVFEYIPLVAKLQPKYWSVISVRKKYDGLLKNVLDYILLCALKINNPNNISYFVSEVRRQCRIASKGASGRCCRKAHCCADL